MYTILPTVTHTADDIITAQKLLYLLTLLIMLHKVRRSVTLNIYIDMCCDAHCKRRNIHYISVKYFWLLSPCVVCAWASDGGDD